MELYTLFERCLSADYVNVGNGGDYAVKREGGMLYIFLERSREGEDWKNNIDFPAKPYKRMGETVWYAHRGFLRVWKSIEEHIAELVRDPSVDGMTVAGYSHGGALAVLCHEYIYFNRPDLRGRLWGYGFGAPRVIWNPTDGVARRWENFLVVRNPDDAVTHLPPAILGYRHMGHVLDISEKGSYSPIDAHREENILKELREL